MAQQVVSQITETLILDIFCHVFIYAVGEWKMAPDKETDKDVIG